MTASDVLIVIGRQYGSGGRALGRELARRFSVPFYDKELLSAAAREFGISLPLFEQHDERRPSLLRTVVEGAFGTASGSVAVESYTPHNLYAMQSSVIEKVAEKGGAVIVGRTADYVLRNNPRLLSIFVHCSDEARSHRIMKRDNIADAAAALEMARRRDRLRQSYYNYYTGRRWGDAANYHMSVDLGCMGLEAGVDLVMQAAYTVAKNLKL